LAGNLVSLTLNFFLRGPGASRDKNDIIRPPALILHHFVHERNDTIANCFKEKKPTSVKTIVADP
jgi:hypothetical protein